MLPFLAISLDDLLEHLETLSECLQVLLGVDSGFIEVVEELL
jgi:hypothetical protein